MLIRSIGSLIFKITTASIPACGIIEIIVAVTKFNIHEPVVRIIEYYDIVRDAIFTPIDVLLFHILSVSMPATLENIITIYLVGSGAMIYTGFQQLRSDTEELRADPSGFEARMREAALSADRDPDYTWYKVHRSLTDMLFRAKREFVAAARWPFHVWLNVKQWFRVNPDGVEQGRTWLGRVFLVLSLVATFFAINFLNSFS